MNCMSGRDGKGEVGAMAWKKISCMDIFASATEHGVKEEASEIEKHVAGTGLRRLFDNIESA